MSTSCGDGLGISPGHRLERRRPLLDESVKAVSASVPPWPRSPTCMTEPCRLPVEQSTRSEKEHNSRIERLRRGDHTMAGPRTLLGPLRRRRAPAHRLFGRPAHLRMRSIFEFKPYIILCYVSNTVKTVPIGSASGRSSLFSFGAAPRFADLATRGGRGLSAPGCLRPYWMLCPPVH